MCADASRASWTATLYRVAAPWIPDASLSEDRGGIAHEFLWAALDCPGAFSFPPPPTGTAVVLAELAVMLSGEIAAGERCVLAAWQIAHEGRKHLTATALFGETGTCRGMGRATWIEVPQPGQSRSGGSRGERV